MSERSEFEETREDMDRAIRRLRILEVVIGLAAVTLAIGGGAVVAFVLSTETELSFRLVWGIASALLLVVPTVIILARERRSRREGRTASKRTQSGDV